MWLSAMTHSDSKRLANPELDHLRAFQNKAKGRGLWWILTRSVFDIQRVYDQAYDTAIFFILSWFSTGEKNKQNKTTNKILHSSFFTPSCLYMGSNSQAAVHFSCDAVISRLKLPWGFAARCSGNKIPRVRARSGDPGIATQNPAPAVDNSSMLGVWTNSQMSQSPLLVCISVRKKNK